MSKRTDIIRALINHLVDSGVVLSGNITRRLAFLHEVNDFPAICLTARSETRFHYGDNARLGQLAVDIRAYTYDSDAISAAELYARRIEQSIDAFSAYDLQLHEARILSVRTDEGLFEPHGIIDMTLQLTYEVKV